MTVIDAIRKHPQSVPAEATIAQAARAMDEAAVGALAVTDGGQLVGIVTDRDIVVRAVARRIDSGARVDSVMTPSPVTIDATADLHDAVSVLRTRPFRRLPVVDGSRFVGMVTVDDLLVDLTSELGDLLRPVTGQVIFGHPEAAPPARAG